MAGESGEDEIAHLNTGRGNDIAETEVEFDQKLGEIVQQHKKNAKSAHVQTTDGFGEMSVGEVGLQKTEQINQ